MKKIRSLLFTCLLAVLSYSCGDAGFGFDVQSEVPVDAGNISISVPATPGGSDLNQEAFDFEYNLRDVDEFSDAVDEINKAGAEAFILGIYYEVTGINTSADTDYDENVPVENVELRFINLAGNDVIFPLPFDGGGILDNVSRTELVLSDDVRRTFEQRLLSQQGLDLRFIFDAGTVPTDGTEHFIDYVVTLHFDVALRVKNINN